VREIRMLRTTWRELETELWDGLRHRQRAKAAGKQPLPGPTATAPALDPTGGGPLEKYPLGQLAGGLSYFKPGSGTAVGEGTRPPTVTQCGKVADHDHHNMAACLSLRPRSPARVVHHKYLRYGVSNATVGFDTLLPATLPCRFRGRSFDCSREMRFRTAPRSMHLRFMILVKADTNSEAGILPDQKLLTEMGKYNAALAQAGVLLAGEGLHPSSKGARHVLWRPAAGD
jgi:hypothetical protein